MPKGPARAPAAEAPAPKPKGLLASVCKEASYRVPNLSAAKVRSIAQGFNFLEGPVWLAQSQSLLFSDMQPASGPDSVQPSHVRRWSGSKTDTFLENAGTNGLALGSDGKLYACAHDNESVSIFDLGTKARSLLVDRVSGKRFNSPNDLTLRSAGMLYFT
ncbi:MAG TPA: SMP-30/gluconolactonase/LRE family protein, partial [Polyangiaceae bacterium]|nr:SMP-30/gluconolactonase/LRE family protein [Polyangiaceae bacterium]